MESEKIHYHHHEHHQKQQLQLVESSPPPLANSSFYEIGTTRAAPNWTPNSISDINGDFGPHNMNSTSMIQDMGFGSFTSLSPRELQLARIKEELSSPSSNHSYQKFTEMLNSPSSSSSSSYTKNEQRDLLKTFSSGCQINGLHLPPPAGGYYSRGTFSQIYPTINISNLNQSASTSLMASSSLDMNLEALDLFNSARFGGSSNQPSQNHLDFLKSSRLPYGLDNMQQLSHRPSNNETPFNNGAAEVKRSSSSLETKSPQATTKKSRLDSRSSCPPFKVRKEKLGDRIAALQQLVAPFGKTDTASVLMEAIGYIKFLQNQVETLSVPYMKASRNKTIKMQGGSREHGQEEGTRNLRSRGLCLVPLSCLSYVTDGGGGGGGVWPPPNFNGGSS